MRRFIGRTTMRGQEQMKMMQMLVVGLVERPSMAPGGMELLEEQSKKGRRRLLM